MAGSRGTIRCYYRHTEVADPYARIGSQDITSHVDFTSLAFQGQKNGLEVVGYVTQGDFLRKLGLNRLLRRLRAEELDQRQVEANSMGMLDLARAGGMGNFKVLVQGRRSVPPACGESTARMKRRPSWTACPYPCGPGPTSPSWRDATPTLGRTGATTMGVGSRTASPPGVSRCSGLSVPPQASAPR